MKYTTISTIAALLLGAASLQGQTSAFTDPAGFVTVNVTPAPAAGQTAITAFSVSLRNGNKFSNNATAVSGQTITVTGAGWTPTTQWADASNPHLVYISSASGVESFLITANTADTLTVAASFDLSTRFANDASIFIVEATTLGDLFGAAADVPFLKATASSDADNLFLWNGSAWVTYFHNGTSWKSSTNPFGNADNDVIFPDDGVFVLRRSTDALSLVFTGNVPVNTQVTPIASGSSFVGSRYPVDTQISDMGFENLPNWVTAASSADADRVYFWNGTAWVTYWHNGTSWKKSTNPFGNADTDVIPGSSALFVFKGSAGDGGAVGDKPYNLDN